jgi:hypothetical protein
MTHFAGYTLENALPFSGFKTEGVSRFSRGYKDFLESMSFS